jgi:hypothetical protein
MRQRHVAMMRLRLMLKKGGKREYYSPMSLYKRLGAADFKLVQFAQPFCDWPKKKSHVISKHCD